METLTFKQFARRYKKGDEQAREWIERGTAPAKKVGARRYLILVAWCDAYDRGEPGFWERATPEPVVTSSYLRRVS